MPRLDETTHAILDGSHEAGRRARSGIANFFDWIFSDNVLEVATGVIIASAFSALVTSFSSDILLPIVSLLPFLSRNFEEKFAVLKRPRGVKHVPYKTLKQALDDGAVVMAYGAFINKIVNFLIVGLALYIIGRLYGWASGDKVIKHTVKCKYCRKSISEKARRCVNCTSWQDGRED